MTPTPIQLDTNHQVNTVQDSTLAQAQRNATFGYQSEVTRRNAAKVAEYNAAFDAYAAGQNARADASIWPPTPAVAEIVVATADGLGVAIVPGSEHVCPTKVWTAPVVTANTHGAITSGGLFQGTATDPFLSAAVYGTPVAYGGMKFLRVA